MEIEAALDGVARGKVDGERLEPAEGDARAGADISVIHHGTAQTRAFADRLHVGAEGGLGDFPADPELQLLGRAVDELGLRGVGEEGPSVIDEPDDAGCDEDGVVLEGVVGDAEGDIDGL